MFDAPKSYVYNTLEIVQDSNMVPKLGLIINQLVVSSSPGTAQKPVQCVMPQLVLELEIMLEIAVNITI